ETAQLSWLARVHAAGGFCIDELSLADDVSVPLTISFSTTDGVTDLEAAAFAGGAIIASFSQPLRREKVVLTATVGETTRTVSIPRRTFNAFQARRASLGLGTSVVDLQSFKRQFPAFPLTITGW
ncbi:MAG: hypothetical protein JWM25_619, partial [Thermoleophilia bacterium]|nr:hypothetical protein [Thermoleophilia bacterium]